jgi:hypothetical protein
MEINKNSKLVLKDVHLYDIESCHYSIMQNLGLDLSGINKEDKTERNIQIGKMMRKNPKLTSLLRNTTRSIIDEYIRVNDLTEDDIILRQYDGILIHKKILRITDLKGIPLNIRKEFLVFISSIDRKKYLALDREMNVVIKGIPYRYDEMDEIYKRICRIVDSARKESIFRRLQEIKDYVMTTQNAKLFGIPVGDNKYNIYLKGYGQMEVMKATLKIMDPDDIDRDRYFNYYIAPFTKSIVVEFVR